MQKNICENEMYSTILCCVVDVDHPQLLGRPKLLKQLRCADITRLHRLAQARGSQASKGAAATGHGCLQIHISETGFLDESSVDDACYIHTCICHHASLFLHYQSLSNDDWFIPSFIKPSDWEPPSSLYKYPSPH